MLHGAARQFERHPGLHGGCRSRQLCRRRSGDGADALGGGKAVSRLEDRLGARLLNRTTRAVSMTDEGRHFHEHGVAIVTAVEEAEASVARGMGTPRGVLRVTVPDAFGRIAVLPLLTRYLETWPDVQVEVSFSDRVADLVEDGFDLAVRIGAITTDTRLVSRVVARYPSVLCASPSYLARHGEPRDPGELSDHQGLVFSSRGHRQSWRFRDRDGRTLGTQVKSRLRLDSAEAIRDAAVAGLGIALLPGFLAAADIAADRLRRLLTDLATDEMEIVAVYPSRRFLEPRVRRFIDMMVERLGS